MSNRLGGKQGTSYLGTNANQPPNWTFSNRDPNQYDTQNVSLGDLWLNEDNENVYVLTSLQGNSMSKGQLAMWTQLESGGGTGLLNELTGDSGGVVTPDGSSNINIISGISGLAFVGNTSADNHTLTLNSTLGADIVQELTGNTGPAVTALNGNINVIGDGTTVTVAGDAGAHTLTISAISTITGLTGNSGGEVFPTGGNINLVGDGVGITITGNPGTHTLTASLVGSGVAEEFVTDSGTAIPSGGIINIITLNSAQNSGSSVEFLGAGDTVQLNVTDQKLNTIVGFQAGNATLTGVQNVSLGASTLTGLTTGSNNIAIGESSGTSITTGINNTSMGYTSLDDLTTGTLNTAIGSNAGGALITGGGNTLLGGLAGSGYTTNESFNTCIGYRSNGTAGESNTLRIGASSGPGTLTSAYIGGIQGVNVGSTANVVTAVGNQLGTAVITAGSNITITPGANTITISSTGGGGSNVAFFAYLTNFVSSATGNGAVYNYMYDTVGYNTGGGFNPSNSIFTAPTTGLYNFSFTATFSGMGSAMTNGYVYLISSRYGAIIMAVGNFYSMEAKPSLFYTVSGNTYINMTTGDTVYLQTAIYGGPGNSVSIVGYNPMTNSLIANSFSGAQVR